MNNLPAYAGLFGAALAAATILPAQSEAVLVGLLLTDAYSPVLLLAVASFGNTAGSVVNWLLGRSVERYRDRRWFPVDGQLKAKMAKLHGEQRAQAYDDMGGTNTPVRRLWQSQLKRGRAQGWYRRYGRWSLLLSWAPLVGDPLTVVAGVMREPFPVFLLLVALAKTGRYVALTAVTMSWI